MARIDDYREAFRLACQELAKVNLHRICSLSGAIVIEDKNGNPAISISFMNQDHLIHFEPEVDVILQTNREPVPIPEKILILHYLLTARGESFRQNLITFRQVPEGPFYYSAFVKRALEPLAQTFGPGPQRLLECGSQLGAIPDELGDASITLKPLPHVTVTLVIWGGDDELPPQANILFDESIVSYLPTEDIAVLCSMIVYRLIRIKQSLNPIKPG
ncbi:MAG: DUF3786 domain-containing protein [Deltaproteobacteria bacterium]|nr:DUF3786 domain-containing protein [Deltaproteobacteria bacterium]